MSLKSTAYLVALALHAMTPGRTHAAPAASRRRPVARARMVAGPDNPDDERNGPDDNDTATGVTTKTRAKTAKPSMYKVLMLNDDYTPMEFVVHVLQRFFRMSMEDATRVMLHVHQRGVGVCGIFTYEVAETKVGMVMDFARKHEHPLQCTMEKA